MNKHTPVLALAALGLVLTGCGGASDAAQAKPRVVTTTVTLPPKVVTPQSCLDALDDAAEGAGLFVDYNKAVGEYPAITQAALLAGIHESVPEIKALTARIKSMTTRIKALNAKWGPLNAKVGADAIACRAGQ